MDIYLVRHGQSEFNVGLTDFLDSSLTTTGQRQAELTAERLCALQLTHILCSPLRRTLQTSGWLADRMSLKVSLVPQLCEYFSNEHYLSFEGLRTSELLSRFPFAQIASPFPLIDPWWPNHVETLQDILDRVHEVRNAIINLEPVRNACVVVISHADTLGRLLEVLTGTYPDPHQPPWNDNCGISHLHHEPGDEHARLIFSNDTSHLVLTP